MGYNCTDVDFLKLVMYSKAIISLIIYVIPIGLIVMMTIDAIKGVMNPDEGFKSMWSMFGKRIIAIIILFFVPTIANIIFSTIDKAMDNSLACYNLANNEDIRIIAVKNVEDYVKKLNKDEITLTQIQELERNINKISNKSDRQKYESILESYKATYNEKQKELAKKEQEERDKIKEQNKNNQKKHNKTLFVGDSRTVGMCSVVALKSSEDCSIAKGAMGYSWFVNTAMPSIKSKLSNDPNYNVVINMGTNDLYSTNAPSNYAARYKELKEQYPKANIIVVSVTQIEDSKARSYGYTVTNSMVVDFNNKLKKALSNKVSYCNVYSKISNSHSTSDGIHYTSSTYNTIYNEIQKCIG